MSGFELLTIAIFNTYTLLGVPAKNTVSSYLQMKEPPWKKFVTKDPN